MVPYKHVGAAEIGWALHEVLVKGRALEAVAAEVEVCRQTVANWLSQFGVFYVAHLTVLLPQLSGTAGMPAAVPPPLAAPDLRPERERMQKVWCVMLALAVRWLMGVPPADIPVRLLTKMQPELAQLRPAAGLFRVPLHVRTRARGPPVDNSL